jgi:hypothetical protein
MTQASVSKQGRWIRLVAWWCLVGILAVDSATVRAQPPAVRASGGGRLTYERDQHGNRIPDFSHCGYAGADAAIPNVPIRVTVAPADGDDGPRIQAAIDQVAGLPLGADGFRGAIRLAPGQFEVAGQLSISSSGIVLRGSGAGEGGTTLIASGQDRRALIRIAGINDRQLDRAKKLRVADEYVPGGRGQVGLIRPLDCCWRCCPCHPPQHAGLDQDAGMDVRVGWKPVRATSAGIASSRPSPATRSLDAPITTAIESTRRATVQAPGRGGLSTSASRTWTGIGPRGRQSQRRRPCLVRRHD